MMEKNEVIKIDKDITNKEYYPVALRNEEVNLERYTKLPLENIAVIGTAFEPLAAVFKKFVLGNSGTSGLYWVNTKGKQLAQFNKKPGYLGSLLTDNGAVGGGQAILKPLVCDPATLFMAAALMSINKKLDEIQETQKEIIEFLEQKEKAKLRGNHIFLTDILNNYKHNWTNEKYKNSNHIKVLDIKQDSEQSIIFYREQIDRKIKKQSLIHSDKFVKDKLRQTQNEFKEYQLALYLYAFSSFLEVMLLENFRSAYLDGVAQKIEDYTYQYRDLYSECYAQIEGYSKSSVQSYLLSGLASINKAAGETAAKIPVVSKSQIDETLIETSNRLGEFSSKKTENTMEELAIYQISAVHPFIEDIKAINRLHNQPMELIFDAENIYFCLPEISG